VRTPKINLERLGRVDVIAQISFRSWPVSTSNGYNQVKQGRLTSHLVITSFLELTSVDHRKPLTGLIESYDEIIEHGRRVSVSGPFQGIYEATSVVEDVNVELELVRIQVRFDAPSQERGRFVSAFLSLCDQRGKEYCPIAIDQHHHSFFTSLNFLRETE